MKVPENLIYFCSFRHAVGILKSGRIPLESATLHRNPFLTTLPAAGDPDYAPSQEEFEEELHYQYERLPENLRSIVSFDYFLKQSERKQEEIEEVIRRKKAGEGQRGFPDVYRMLASLSLFENHTHYGLWQYRADQHRGVALVLNCDSGIFHSDDSQPLLLMPVNYTNQKRVKASAENPFPGCYDLPPEMASEREWRVLRPARLKKNGLSITRGSLERVIYGALCPSADRETLNHLLKIDMRYKSLRKSSMSTAPAQLELKLNSW